MELQPYEQEHINTLRRLAPECMVLLKSDGSFPLNEPCEIALYGSGARKTVKGGTGSGDVNVRHFVTVEEGLENAGFTITTKDWMDAYDREREKARITFYDGIKKQAAATGVPAFLIGMGAVLLEPEYDLPLNGSGDTAVYVLARISGEGNDRKPLPGDLLLTKTEVRDILTLAKSYQRFMLVLNVAGVVDLTPVQQVSNILLLSQVGMTIGDSFADVLLGKRYPSGKLATTWAAWEDYCKVGDFGEQDDTRYKEGIYVGYRYFDSVNQEPLYPFGYGIGFTSFSITNTAFSVNGTKVTVETSVENTGGFAGKEVVQLYVSVPEGKLDQPYQTLAAFVKTNELKSGEKQAVTMQFDLAELASFDTDSACSVLEAGEYILRVGNSSRNTQICGVVRLEETVVISRLHRAGGTPDFEDWKPERAYPKEQPDISVASVRAEALANNKECRTEEIDPNLEKWLDSLSDSDLAYLCIGNFNDKTDSGSVIGNAGITVVGSAGETCGRFADLPFLVMADGPAGLRLSPQYGVDEQGAYPVGASIDPIILELLDDQILALLGIQKDAPARHGEIHDQYCSAIPVGTALAQTWNPDLCEECGDLVGEEMERFGVHLWLAPAMNIHRNVLCGRNFEYYSEDPLISGKMAAGITRGVQKHPGRGATVKHFACNNQETNRFRSNSLVSQRALRDIYLRGFQIVIQEAQPHAVMTSYNLLNGEHTSQRRDLVTDILREEWGFQGIVMSDWITTGGSGLGMPSKYPYACASGSIKAGNDVMMPGNRVDHKDVMAAITDPNHLYPLTRAALKESAARIVRMATKLTKEAEVTEFASKIV